MNLITYKPGDFIWDQHTPPCRGIPAGTRKTTVARSLLQQSLTIEPTTTYLPYGAVGPCINTGSVMIAATIIPQARISAWLNSSTMDIVFCLR
jgi:hypothetical protein